MWGGDQISTVEGREKEDKEVQPARVRVSTTVESRKASVNEDIREVEADVELAGSSFRRGIVEEWEDSVSDGTNTPTAKSVKDMDMDKEKENGKGRVKETGSMDVRDAVLSADVAVAAIDEKKGNTVIGFLSFLVGKSYPSDTLENSNSNSTSSQPLLAAITAPVNVTTPTALTATTTTTASTLWVRRITYVHNDAGGLFSAQSSSNHSLAQVMKVRVRVRVGEDKLREDGTDFMVKQKKEEEDSDSLTGESIVTVTDVDKREKDMGKVSVSTGTESTVTESVTIVGFMNLSNMPFCQNCTYTTRWEFRRTDMDTVKGSSKNEKKNDKKGVLQGTSVSVFLSIDCPSSIYHSFIVSGIKKELKAVAEQFQKSSQKLLDEVLFTEKAVRGEGERALLGLMGGNMDDYQIIRRKRRRGRGTGDVGYLITQGGEDDREGERGVRGEGRREDVDRDGNRNRNNNNNGKLYGGEMEYDMELDRDGNRIEDNDVYMDTDTGLSGYNGSDGDQSLDPSFSTSFSTSSSAHDENGISGEEGNISVGESEGADYSTGVGNIDRDSNSNRNRGRGGGKGGGRGGADLLTVTVPSPDLELTNNFNRLRDHWRLSATVMTSLKRAPTAFSDHLAVIGLRRKRRTGIFGILRLRVFFRIFFWGGLSAGALELSKRSGDIAGATVAAKRNVRDFIQRRITTPTVSIMNDVVLNRRVTILDREALIDARRSLSVMLYDFLSQHKPKLTEQERRKLVNGLDMRPISEEYERELRRPIRSILSGQIAKLVLIQLQFVKKELLEAMQAIDELFNANQVNLQLLAVTPAILSLFFVQGLSRTVISVVKNSSRGRFVESTGVVHRELRTAMRSLERLLCMTQELPTTPVLRLGPTIQGQGSDLTLSTDRFDPDTDKETERREFTCGMPVSELGVLMSILYRIQNLLVLNSSHFEDITLRFLQEDLRDVSVAKLTAAQRLALVERIIRSYSFLQPQRKLFQ